MHLSLTNFLCHDKLEIDIPDKSIVLIKGERGKGKSSLIKSIAWVLYGNIKKVTPFKAPNVKTSVVLTMDNLQVTRTKKPNKLTLTQNNIVYENQEAQKKIDNLFGTYDIWLATSYVMQKKENLFLTTSNAEKMDILNTIAFHDELPSSYINMIEKSLDKNKHLQQIKSTLFNKKLAQFNEEDLQLLGNVLEDQEEVIRKLQVAKETLSNLLKIKKERDIAVAIKNNKEEELHHLRNELMMLNKEINSYTGEDEKIQQIVSRPTEEGIQYLETTLSNLDAIDVQIKRKNELEILLKSLENISDKTFTEEDYITAKKQEEQYYYNDNILKMYELDHDEEQIQDCIEYFRTIISSQETLLLEQQLTTEEDKLNKLEEQLCNITNKIQVLDTKNITTMIGTTNTLKQNLFGLEQQLKDWNVKIQCPHCLAEVLYRDGKLVTFNNDTNDTTLKEKIRDIQNTITENTIIIDKHNQEYDTLVKNKHELTLEFTNIKNSIENITKTLSGLPKAVYPKILNATEKEKTYESINKLKSIVIVSLPDILSDIIQNTIKYKLYKDEYDLLPNHDTMSFCVNDIHALHELVKHLKVYLSKLDKIQEHMGKLELQIHNIIIVNDPSQQILVVENNITYLETSLVNHKKALKVLKEHEALTAERNEVLQLTQKVEDLTTLKQYAIDIECKVLQDIVAGINVSLHAICTSLFDDLILELCLYKTLKNKNEDTKPCVHFTVYYKGCVYDNVNSLSVGELDQVSLAIALAFHKLSPNPFIMYDEISANLNSEHKNMNINAIREHTNCTVLYVQHDGTDGVFDHIIDIEQYT